MDKEAKFLKILGIIFLVIIIIAVAVGIYFYNFYVFKTLRVCITENSYDSNLNCDSNMECINIIDENSEEFAEKIKQIENAPGFIKEKIDEVFDQIIYCDGVCKVKEVRGLDNFKEIGLCSQDEKEIKIEIRGKEGLQILRWLKEQK